MKTIHQRPRNLVVVLIFLNFLLVFLTNYLLVDDSLFYDFWGNKFSYEQVSRIVASNKKWEWLVYVLLPVFLLFKILIVDACLTVGGLLLRIEDGFGKFLSAIVIAEFIFLIPGIIKILWFVFVQTEYTLQDLQLFFPLSIINLFDPTELDPWLVYPLQLLNIFEILYWVVLASQLQEVLGKSFSKSLAFVCMTYGTGLFIWVILVMFLIVSLS